MVLYHNLNFFDKQGKKLNLNKEEYVIATVNRNDDTVVDYIDAKIEVVTNVYGNIELFHIKNTGTKYNDKVTILISDIDTGTTYLIDSSEYISLGPNGEILDIQLPSNPSGFCYPSFTYSGNVFFPKISVDLIETAQIYVLEEMQDTVTKESIYSSPRTFEDSFGTKTTQMTCAFLNGSEEISLFDIDYSDKYPAVQEVSSCVAVLDDGDNDIIDNGVRQTTLLKSNAQLWNVYVKSNNEGIFERSLVLYETVDNNTYVYAAIHFRAEIEGEDERLRLMLENFGIQLNLQELKIFRDSDVNEELPNYLLLNEKRKEMLLEYHNIFPYIGSYKALINIINFFGYGDIRLKEYWLNTKLTKSNNSTLSLSNVSQNLPIDLVSLHTFAKTFKPLPILNTKGNINLTPNIGVPSQQELPKFDEDNVDITNKDEKNLTSFPKISNGKVIGKRSYILPNDISEPTNIGSSNIETVSSIQLINAIQDKITTSSEQNIESIYEQHFKQIEIPLQLKEKGKHWQSEEMLPNKIWKKTNLFGLFYDITKESGEYDEYGMPITEDAFMFTEDEVLIKLFGLREYLKEKFMPLNARIIDIVGEGIYFDRWVVNIWKDDVIANTINQTQSVDFSITDKEFLISDLQDYGGPVSQPISSTKINTLKDVFVNNFSNPIAFKNDKGPVGCNIELDLNSFDISWNDMNVAWDDLLSDSRFVRRAYTDGSSLPQITLDIPNRNIEVNYIVKNNEILPYYTKIIMHSEDGLGNQYTQTLDVDTWDPNTGIIHITEIDGDFSIATNAWIEYVYFLNNLTINTWDTVGQGDYYEVEWYAIHENADKFAFNIRGSINLYSSINIDLPYEGKYNITCILYDLTNHSVRKQRQIEVKMPIVDFICFGRSINPIITWDDAKDVTWDDVNSQWRNIAHQNNVTWNDLDGITWDDLDISKYEDQEDPFLQNNNKKILRISEKDRYVGDIISFDTQTNTVVCNGHFSAPMLRNANGSEIYDYVFFRIDQSVYRMGVIQADYSTIDKTILTLDYLPSGLSTSWELLREIGNTILIEGDISSSINTTEGVSSNQYIMLSKNEEDKNSRKNILISDIIQPDLIAGEDEIQGIVLPSSIIKTESEFGKIYKVRTAIESGLGDTFSYDTVNKTLTLNFISNVDEIIEGFTTIYINSNNIDGSIIEQRLLVKKLTYQGITTKLEVVELDNDMGIMIYALNNTLSYTYWEFIVKLRHFKDNDLMNVYLNFNDYPYISHFITEATPFSVLNGEWYFDYVIKDGDYSLQIINVGYENGNTLLTLDDPYSDLYRVSPRFELTYTTFDEDYAINRYGTDIFVWNNFNETVWDDLKHLTWNMFEYDKAPLCGFKINKVNPNGIIQFNENPFFEFTTIPMLGEMIGSPLHPATEYDQFVAAVDELNSTENIGLRRFNYTLLDNGNTPAIYQIHAIAKGEGIYYLGYINFDNGVIGEYIEPSKSHSFPIGNFTNWNNPYLYGQNNYYANWNAVARAYYEYGYDYTGNRGWYPAEQLTSTVPIERYVYNPSKNSFLYYNPFDLDDPIYTKFPSLLNSVLWKYDEAYRLLYDYSITSPFTWDDIIAAKSSKEINKMTTLFFTATNSKVAGKHLYKWKISKRNEQSKDDICIVDKEFLIWTFSQTGKYDVTLEITDINNNTSELTKNAFIIVK